MAKRTCKRRRSRHRKRIATLITSPLARGTVLPRNPQSLIPACAGQTWGRFYGVPVIFSHPRLRGADAGERWARTRVCLSSPLARGRPSCSTPSCPYLPLIPACAGQTHKAKKCKLAGSSHPRLRGADAQSTPWPSLATLSSPLARGRRHARV